MAQQGEETVQGEELTQLSPPVAQFGENVLREKSQVVFVTVNVPGSNNDGLPWKGGSKTVSGNPHYATHPVVRARS
ncbi:MAG TPA: hypothetical protein VGX03_06680 [Candidatus Binatia bacterium]|jgi:hypothetical protein|nr:hypothetical protein [Candidatus Binatia bacterium]